MNINGAQPSDPVQDAIKTVEHYLFRGTNTMACCLCLTDGSSFIALSTLSDGEQLPDLHTRCRMEAEAKVAAHLTEKGNTHGNTTH